ncbi:MAG: hypothetical protein ABJD24_07185 [Acidimicrobiales bacterium]
MEAPHVAPGRLVRLGVIVPKGMDQDSAGRLARMCDLARIDVVWVDDPARARAMASEVSHAKVLVRPERDEPWARTVAVSIGRTEAEAAARADADPAFAHTGDPREGGLFGTLEQCQDAVIALAHQGVVDVRCVLPDAPDVHDVIAQLTAVAIGSLATHRPDAARSAAPPPPPWSRPDQ